MKTAFLFVEKYPNYDLVLQVLKLIRSEEEPRLETYIQGGLWGLDEYFYIHYHAIPQEVEIRQQFISQILFPGQGNICKFKKPEAESFPKLASETIYVVQFSSLN